MNTKYKLSRPPKETPALYEQENCGESAVVYAHYFLPGTGADWYVTEYCPERELIFGWAEILKGCGEWGYTSLAELEVIELPLLIEYNGKKFKCKIPMRVERDLNWTARTMREILASRK